MRARAAMVAVDAVASTYLRRLVAVPVGQLDEYTATTCPPAIGGIASAHAAAILDVTALRGAILIREVNPTATPLILAGYPTKPLSQKAKSSDWGPHAGFIPANSYLSKSRDASGNVGLDAALAMIPAADPRPLDPESQDIAPNARWKNVSVPLVISTEQAMLCTRGRPDAPAPFTATIHQVGAVPNQRPLGTYLRPAGFVVGSGMGVGFVLVPMPILAAFLTTCGGMNVDQSLRDRLHAAYTAQHAALPRVPVDAVAVFVCHFGTPPAERQMRGHAAAPVNAGLLEPGVVLEQTSLASGPPRPLAGISRGPATFLSPLPQIRFLEPLRVVARPCGMQPTAAANCSEAGSLPYTADYDLFAICPRMDPAARADDVLLSAQTDLLTLDPASAAATAALTVLASVRGGIVPVAEAMFVAGAPGAAATDATNRALGALYGSFPASVPLAADAINRACAPRGGPRVVHHGAEQHNLAYPQPIDGKVVAFVPVNLRTGANIPTIYHTKSRVGLAWLVKLLRLRGFYYKQNLVHLVSSRESLRFDPFNLGTTVLAPAVPTSATPPWRTQFDTWVRAAELGERAPDFHGYLTTVFLTPANEAAAGPVRACVAEIELQALTGLDRRDGGAVGLPLRGVGAARPGLLAPLRR